MRSSYVGANLGVSYSPAPELPPTPKVAFFTKALSQPIGKHRWKKLKLKIDPDQNSKTWVECLSSDDRELWIDAVFTEHSSLIDSQTFQLDYQSENARISDACLICLKKRNALNNVVKWKARIVVRGSRQI